MGDGRILRDMVGEVTAVPPRSDARLVAGRPRFTGRAPRAATVVVLVCLGVLMGVASRHAGPFAGADRLAAARLGPGGVAQAVADESQRSARRAALAGSAG
ncbi:hypothetical protein ND747_08055, partial [Frankia sp. R82]|nr:hypothetical protein [Frankia sp. R82]